MKYLQNKNFDWTNIKAVGFDIDGTLYDEFDFIIKVYDKIADIFKIAKINNTEIKTILLKKWLEKGSSYPFIFKEVIEELSINSEDKDNLLKKCIDIYRNHMPIITLSDRVNFLLNDLKSNYELFIITDGSTLLQWNKIISLNLDQYVSKKNIIVTGEYGKLYNKPSSLSISKLDFFVKKNIKESEVVYIGDREVDFLFAINSGFHYIDIRKLFIKL